LRYSLFPIVFLYQIGGKIAVIANGISSGYDEIHYSKRGTGLDHLVKLDSPEVILENFPEGAGLYKFYLTKDKKKTMPIEAYVSEDGVEQTCKRIMSYIAFPEDAEYMTDEMNEISSTTRTCVKTLVSRYRMKEDVQPYEIRAMCQLIDMAERYENIAAMTMNRDNVDSISIKQSTLFSIIAKKMVSGIVDVYRIESESREYVGTFPLSLSETFILEAVPDALYEMDVFLDGELAVRLVHYQPDEEGAAYLWGQEITNLASIEKNMANDIQLSETGIDLTDEDKERLLLERRRKNNNALIGQVKLWRNMNRDAILNVEIPDYDLLVAIGKDFYLSVREPDQFLDTSFDKRYLITSRQMAIDTAQDCLYDDMIFYVEDENRVVVSSFIWYTMEDDNESLEEYTEKQYLLEMHEYAEDMNRLYAQKFGRGEDYQQFSNIITSLSQDNYDSTDEILLNAVYDIVHNPSYFSNVDNVVSVAAIGHMSKPYCDQQFFQKSLCPTFYYARDAVVFPGKKNRYVLVLLKARLDAEGNPAIKKEYIVPTEHSSTSVSIARDDICMMYAIDADTYNRSGFILFNNISSRVYCKNNIEMGVIVGG